MRHGPSDFVRVLGLQAFLRPAGTRSPDPRPQPGPDPPSTVQQYLRRRNIPALDGLRAVAVFLVIFSHFGVPYVPGVHGVMIFFVLSGFLITWLLLREDAETGSVSLAGFYRRRVLRIFPAFYAFWLLLVGALLLTGRPVPWPHAWSAFFYVSDYYNALVGDPNTGFSHTWSLSIEEKFYLLWPWLFLWWRRDLAKLTLYLAVLILSIWVYRAILVLGFAVDQGYIYEAFDTRLDELMMGCLLAVLLRRGSPAGFWRVMLATPRQSVATVALLLASVYFGAEYGHRYRDIYGFALEPLLIAILLAQVVTYSAVPLWSWTEWSWVKYLGRISYPLYLYQQVTIGAVSKVLRAFPIPIQLAGVILVTVAIASSSYYVVERPFLRLKSRSAAVP